MQRKVSFENLVGLVGKSTGLDAGELARQRAKFGANDIVERVGNPWFELLIDTIKDPMVWFLVVIASIFYFIGDYREAIILSLATLPFIFMDAFLHWRTQVSTTGLKSQLSSNVMVRRSGARHEIDSIDVVPGDLVFLSHKTPFLPADGYLEEADSLQVDESVLTGEAFPVAKSSLEINPFIQNGEKLLSTDVLGFAGTRVLTGHGILRVLSTGKNTTYGEIVQSVVKLTHERTPLQQAILELTRSLIYAAVVLCLTLAGIRYYQGHGWFDALLSGAILAVAAIPEEFPVVFTFFLGVGVYRLAKRRALVRRAVCVENIGRVTQICTDKTGTITLGELKLTHIDSKEGFNDLQVLTNALAASNIKGTDPVDLALVNLAKKRHSEMPRRVNVIPFTEDRKRETGFFINNNSMICTIKGSPEVVISKSNLTEMEIREWTEKVNTWAKGGHKVLAVASIEVSKESVEKCLEPEAGFQFNALLAFEDPARPEVREAIQYCRRSGIKVLMITGDHPETAAAIARDIGLTSSEPIVISAELEAEDFEEEWLKTYPDFLKKLDVVARCNPIQKLNIVKALKSFGELVLVTGDGVNDVPALKAADIGVAMGLRGSRSAKEVSSIILTDDNFSTIVGAIQEGKQLFTNLRMSFKYLLLIHIPFVISAAVVPLMGYPLLYLPIHVVWLELIIHPTALFAFQQKALEKNHNDFRESQSFFSRRDTTLILVLGLSFTTFIIVSYVFGVLENQQVGHGRAKIMALLSLWSAGVAIVLTGGRSLMGWVLALATLVTSAILIENRWLAEIFHLTPLHMADWGRLVAIGTVFLFTLQIFQSNKERPRL